ncbi:MAG: M48 family metallopeptidase [Candidatus Saccharimonas sp.]
MEPQQMTKGQRAVKAAYSTSDMTVLVCTFVGFFLLTCAYFIVSYIMTFFEQPDQTPADFILGLLGTLFMGGVLFVGILLFGMFYVRIMRQTILGNSLQIEYSDYAWLRDWANEVAADLQMPRVEIFVTQDPVINAYAFGFARPYCIVLHSGSIRYLTHDELRVVVVHEMAHIKYGHTMASVYLQPFLNIPFVGPIATWFAGFWSRRAELTADRLALMYMRKPELVKESLIKVHVGPDVAKAMNEVARQWLQYTAERPMNRFAQTLSSHPFLVRRLSHIDRYKAAVEPVPPSSVV